MSHNNPAMYRIIAARSLKFQEQRDSGHEGQEVLVIYTLITNHFNRPSPTPKLQAICIYNHNSITRITLVHLTIPGPRRDHPSAA